MVRMLPCSLSCLPAHSLFESREILCLGSCSQESRLDGKRHIPCQHIHAWWIVLALLLDSTGTEIICRGSPYSALPTYIRMVTLARNISRHDRSTSVLAPVLPLSFCLHSLPVLHTLHVVNLIAVARSTLRLGRSTPLHCPSSALRGP